MRYEDLVNLIQNVSVGVNPDGTFIHGRRVDGSLNYDGAMPQIHLYPFITTIDLPNRVDVSNITMGFWMQAEAEANADDSKQFISNADDLMRNFINQLYLHTELDISNVRSEPAYNLFAAILTGYQLTFTITTKHSTCE